jgi:hypothetical protein
MLLARPFLDGFSDVPGTHDLMKRKRVRLAESCIFLADHPPSSETGPAQSHIFGLTQAPLKETTFSMAEERQFFYERDP